MRPLRVPAVRRDERGLTLVEIVVVMIIVAILLGVAVSSYLSFRERANDAAAQSNVYAIVPAIQAYYVDNESYSGMTLGQLKANYDAGLDPALYSFGTAPPADRTYCVQSSSGGRTWRKNGPSAELERQPCP